MRKGPGRREQFATGLLGKPRAMGRLRRGDHDPHRHDHMVLLNGPILFPAGAGLAMLIIRFAYLPILQFRLRAFLRRAVNGNWASVPGTLLLP